MGEALIRVMGYLAQGEEICGAGGMSVCEQVVDFALRTCASIGACL